VYYIVHYRYRLRLHNAWKRNPEKFIRNSYKISCFGSGYHRKSSEFPSPFSIDPQENLARARQHENHPLENLAGAWPGLALKKPTQKNPKNPPKKPTKNVFFWVFLNFSFFMKIIQTFLFQTDFL
jgi:hypothetical protein